MRAAPTRLKRRSDFLRTAASLMPSHAKPGRDYVLIARNETAARPWAQLLEDLEAALRRVRAWREPGETA
jgi:ribonuclease P protein component